ncbi:MAG: hypothetical protein WCP18_02015 [bacterium]
MDKTNITLFKLHTHVDKKIVNHIKKQNKILEQFFEIKLSNIPVTIVDSREEFATFTGCTIQPWLVGLTNYYSICLLNPKIYLRKYKTSKNEQQRFQKLTTHELTHFYIHHKLKVTNPKWLMEGLCDYFASKEAVKPQLKELLNLEHYFSVYSGIYFQDGSIYRVGYFLVDLLIEKYGLNKIKQLIFSLDKGLTPKLFNQLFFKIYGFKLDKKELIKIAKENGLK